MVNVSDTLADADMVKDLNKLLDGEVDWLLHADDVTVGDGRDDSEWDGVVVVELEYVGEVLWLPDDVRDGVGGGVIVMVIDGLVDAEVVLDADRVPNND